MAGTHRKGTASSTPATSVVDRGPQPQCGLTAPARGSQPRKRGAPLRSCLAPLRPSGCLPPALAVRTCIGCVPLPAPHSLLNTDTRKEVFNGPSAYPFASAASLGASLAHLARTAYRS